MSTTDEVVIQDQMDPEDAALAAGFAAARGDEPPAEIVVDAPAEAVADESNPPAVEEEPSAKTLIAGFPEERVRELLEKAGRVDAIESRVFGKLGEFNRTLQQQLQAGDVTEEDLAELREEYPELADHLLKSLQKVTGKMRGAPSVTADTLQNLRTEVANELRPQFEERLVRVAHRDFVSVVQSQDFQTWMAGKYDEESRQRLIGSQNADDVIELLDTYKADKAKRESEANEVANRNKQKQKRLEGAITPRGDGVPLTATLSEEAAMAAAFNAVRGSRA